MNTSKTVTVSLDQSANDKELRTAPPGAEVKLTEWDKEPSVMQLKEDLTAAKPSHDAHVQRVMRWNALRKVTGKYRPKTRPNRSSIQPKLIRRQNEWRYSALTEPFMAKRDLFDLSPITFEDTKGVRQNELLLNWQFRTKINKVKFIDEYVRTAVDEGTTIVRLGWKRETETRITEVPVFEYSVAQTQEELAQLHDAITLKQTNPREFGELPEEIQAAVEYTIENEIPAIARVVGKEEVEEEVLVKNHPTVDVVDPSNIYIDPSAGNDIENANFAIYSFETSKAELLKDGRYTNLDRVNWASSEVVAEPDHNTQTPTDFNFKDELRKRVVAYEYWGFYDIHGNDKLVPIVATWVGDTMIRMEENPFPDKKLPFVLSTYLPVRRQIMGEPDAEILEDNQAVLGALIRGMIDLLGRSANSQQGTAKGFLDAANRRRFEQGLDYEFNPNIHPAQGLYQHEYPDIPASAMTMLNLQNFEAESITGVKSFSGGVSGDAYGDVAAGIKGMLDAASKREMNILRRLAEGIIEIGRKIVAMNAVFLSETEVVRLTNEKFETINREDLPGQYDFKIDISTAEVEMARSQDLGFMLQTMGPDMDHGMVKLILAEIAELKHMPELAHAIRNWEPQPDPLDVEIKQLEIQKLKAEIAQLNAKAQEDQADAAKTKAETDLLNLGHIERETGTEHAREVERIKAQGQANQDLEITKGLLKSRKPEESPPDIAAAVGHSLLTAQRNDAG